MKQNFIFLILSILLASSTADTAVCVSKTLLYCQQLFGDTLNVTDGSNLWDNPASFSYVISSYYKKGVDGLLTVCQARQQFATCLGDRYDACISTTNYILRGKTPSDAKAFVGNWRVLAFDCDGGFIQSSKNFGCINLATNTRSTDLSECWTFYQSDLSNKVPACTAATTYVKCMSGIYGNVCGAETSWWECERTRLGQLFDESCPIISCQISSATSQKNTNTRVAQIYNRVSDISRVIRSLANDPQQQQQHK